MSITFIYVLAYIVYAFTQSVLVVRYSVRNITYQYDLFYVNKEDVTFAVMLFAFVAPVCSVILVLRGLMTSGGLISKLINHLVLGDIKNGE